MKPRCERGTDRTTSVVMNQIQYGLLSMGPRVWFIYLINLSPPANVPTDNAPATWYQAQTSQTSTTFIPPQPPRTIFDGHCISKVLICTALDHNNNHTWISASLVSSSSRQNSYDKHDYFHYSRRYGGVHSLWRPRAQIQLGMRRPEGEGLHSASHWTRWEWCIGRIIIVMLLQSKKT